MDYSPEGSRKHNVSNPQAKKRRDQDEENVKPNREPGRASKDSYNVKPEYSRAKSVENDYGQQRDQSKGKIKSDKDKSMVRDLEDSSNNKDKSKFDATENPGVNNRSQVPVSTIQGIRSDIRENQDRHGRNQPNIESNDTHSPNERRRTNDVNTYPRYGTTYSGEGKTMDQVDFPLDNSRLDKSNATERQGNDDRNHATPSHGANYSYYYDVAPTKPDAPIYDGPLTMTQQQQQQQKQQQPLSPVHNTQSHSGEHYHHGWGASHNSQPPYAMADAMSQNKLLRLQQQQHQSQQQHPHQPHSTQSAEVTNDMLVPGVSASNSTALRDERKTGSKLVGKEPKIDVPAAGFVEPSERRQHHRHHNHHHRHHGYDTDVGMTGHERNLGLVRWETENALREYQALQRQTGFGPSVEDKKRLQANADWALEGLKQLRRDLNLLAKQEKQGRIGRFVTCSFFVGLVPLVKRYFGRPKRNGTSQTEYAYTRSLVMSRHIRDILREHVGWMAPLFAFVLSALVFFQAEITIRVAKTMAKRLKQLVIRLEDAQKVGKDGMVVLDQEDFNMLHGWRWRVLLWAD